MSGTRKRPEGPAVVEVADHAQGVTLPGWLTNTQLVTGQWSTSGAVAELARRLRKLVEGDAQTAANEYLAPLFTLKLALCHDGFEVLVPEALAKKNLKAAPWFPTEARRIANDVWREWLLSDNAAIFWMRSQTLASGAPAVTVLDTESIVSYSNGLGGEALEVTVPQNSNPPKGLDQRWVDAMKGGKALKLDPAKGEFFRVMTRAKRGRGLARPSMAGALPLLGTLELLSMADAGGALEHRNIIRHFKIGHEIKMGDRSGKSDHFIKPKHITALKRALKNKSGVYDLMTNFDWEIAHAFLDPKFFDKTKYEGVLMRFNRWMGPFAMLLSEKMPEGGFTALRAAGEYERAEVGAVLEELFNSPEYWGGKKLKPEERIRVRWNPNTFKDAKQMLETVRFGVSQGLLSPQTGRRMLGVDDDRESELMIAAHAKKENYTPPFEQKQGQGGADNDTGGDPDKKKQGRPPESK